MLEEIDDSELEKLERKIRATKAEHDANCSADDRRNWDVPIATPSELKWRHQHWWKRRSRIAEYLSLGWIGRRIYDRFSNCGAMATVQWSAIAQRHRVSAILCKTRHCEPCMRQKAGRIAGNLKEKLKSCPPGSFRFITLTLRHDHLTRLDDQLRRLIKHFRALRARPIWKLTQRGGCFTVEVKYSAGGWHAHLHVISEGSWCDRESLRDAWSQITGDSFQADIRRIPDADALAGYVVKYITKSTSETVWDNIATAKEYLLAIKGTRTCATLGTWRGLKLTKPTHVVEDWQHVATLHDVLDSAKANQPWATAIVLSVRPPSEHTEHKHPSGKKAHRKNARK
jgi:hypothetical protein